MADPIYEFKQTKPSLVNDDDPNNVAPPADRLFPIPIFRPNGERVASLRLKTAFLAPGKVQTSGTYDVQLFLDTGALGIYVAYGPVYTGLTENASISLPFGDLDEASFSGFVRITNAVSADAVTILLTCDLAPSPPVTYDEAGREIVAITAPSLPLPAGAATAARQDTGNASLASIDGKVSTAANQATEIATLASIDAKTFSYLQGLLGSGLAGPIRATGSRELAVEIGGSNTSAFGDINTAEHEPIFQYDFVYQSTFNPQLCFNTVANGGSATVSQGRLLLQTGVAANGSAIHQSTKIARYRAGQGNMARFTWAFTVGVAGSTQIAGMANVGTGTTALDGYFFGYNGVAYGILHRCQYLPDTWYPQTAWNVDRCDGSGGANNPSGFNIAPTFGNVYMVRYPYLGYGDILFFVQDQGTARWILVHVIKYTNSSTVLQLGNPGLNFYAQVLNTGNTSNLQGLCGSVGAFLSGQRVFTGPQGSALNRITTNTANVEKVVLSLRNAATFNGVANRGMVRLRSLSVAGDGSNTDCYFLIRRNVNTLATPAPVFAPYYGATADNGVTLTTAQSIVSVDRASTRFTADAVGTSTQIFNTAAARNTGYQIDMTAFDLYMLPGDIFTFTQTSGANNNTVTIAVNWNEDV